MFTVKIVKEGFIFFVRLPAAICKKLGVRAGDYVEISECSEFPDNDMVCIRKAENEDVGNKGNTDRNNKGGGL